MFSSLSKLFVVLVIVTLAIGVFTTPILASVMSSDNFKIQLDSINVGGGMGTSASYKMEDTVGEIGTGYISSTNFGLYAGYQQNDVETYISLTTPDSMTLMPSIGGLTGGRGTATGTYTVLTNSNTGYTLNINASTSPAMKSTDASSSASFANYTLAGSVPDYDWFVSSTDSEFGFSVFGTDVITRYYSNGSSCNQSGGSNNFDKCWEGVSTTAMVISQGAGPNEPLGSNTDIKFSAESGSSHLQPSGDYQAIIIVTAYVN